MDLWPKCPPAHPHPKDPAVCVPGSPTQPPHPRVPGGHCRYPMGFAAPSPAPLPLAESPCRTRCRWLISSGRGCSESLNLEKHWGESCFLLCCVSDGEIWGPSCPSPILRGEGGRPHPPSHPSSTQGKACQSLAQPWGSDKGRVWGGVQQTIPSFCLLSSSRSPEMLFPAPSSGCQSPADATRPGSDSGH